MIQAILIHRNDKEVGFNSRRDVAILLMISLICQEGSCNTEKENNEKNNIYKKFSGVQPRETYIHRPNKENS